MCHFHDVELKYGETTAEVVPELTINPGTLTAVIGPSGSGKTTLTHAIGDIPVETLHCVGTVERRGKVGVISQDSFGAFTAGSIENAHELLAQVSLTPELFSRYPLELSGGQRQRAAIAFALGARPQLLLCDEVTSALDPIATAEVVRTLRKLVADSRNGMSIVFISHDLGAAKALCPDVITLEPADPNTDLTAATAIFRKNWDDYS